MPSHASVLFDEQESIPLAKDVFVISQDQASESIYISWNIKDGYYMYLDSIKLKDITNNIPFEIVESHQSLFEDEFFGKTEILKKNFNKNYFFLKNILIGAPVKSYISRILFSKNLL